MGTKVTIGFATWLGTVGAAAGVLIPLLGQLADASKPLGVPSEVWVIVGAVLAVAVVLGRMGQAIAQVAKDAPAGADQMIDELPDEITDVGLDS